MKKTIELADWIEGCTKGRHAQRKKFYGFTVTGAAKILGRTRATVWNWVMRNQLDAYRVIDQTGVEVAVIITIHSIEAMADEKKICLDDYAQCHLEF